MELTPAMLTFLRDQRQRGIYVDDALDSFLGRFLPDDEAAAKAAFEAAWSAAAPPPARPAQAANTQNRRAPPRPHQPQAQRQGGQDILNPAPTAPFRFLPLNDRIALPEAEILAAWNKGRLHDLPLANGYSGRLTVQICFDGPVLVAGPGDAANEAGPVMVGDQYVIPGATLRGLARATLEAAAFARLSQTNLHRRFGIRDFEHDLFKDEARKAVRAGWLRPARAEDGVTSVYVIEPCGWYRVRIRDLKGAASDAASWHRDWLGKDLAAHYDEFGMRNGALFDFDKTCGFDLPTGAGDGQLVVPLATGAPCVPVFSDKVPAISSKGLSEPDKQALEAAKAQYRAACNARNQPQAATAAQEIQRLEIAALEAQNNNPDKGNAKRTEAVFAATGDGSVLPVSKAVWDTFFANNSRPSRHAPKPAGNWKSLKPTLDAGRRVPVFWVADEAAQVADFGFVRVFKRAHKARVVDVLANTGKGAHLVNVDAPDFCPDFVEALFGYVHEPEDDILSDAAQHKTRHLKSRVRFSFARLVQGSRATVTQRITTVQAAPKPSYAPFYLAGTGSKDWSQPGMQLAGRKVYPPRDADLAQVQQNLQPAGRTDNEDTQSHLKFLVPAQGTAKLTFQADLLVHNVTASELGGLIWALTLGGGDRQRHMIGRGKTAGAGQALISVSGLNVTTVAGAVIDTDTAKAAFITHMANEVPGWASSPPVTALLRAADPATWNGARLGYMALPDHAKLRKQAYRGDGPERFLGVTTP